MLSPLRHPCIPLKIVIGDTSDCAIGFFERIKKIARVETLEENKTRTCGERVNYESVSKVYPTSSVK